MLRESEYKLFQQLCKMEELSLLLSLERYLINEYSEERVINGQDKFVYAIGDIPVMLVAHLDTVHAFPPEELFYDREKDVIWAPDGLGADDRAGVFAILRILARGLRPHVLFTTEEEVGCKGAVVAASALQPDVKFVIELDREGIDDSVFYDCENSEFTKYINQYGFTEDTGSFSDISVLCPRWNVAGVNLSIGYKGEHTQGERLYVTHMLNTIEKVVKILREVDVDRSPFRYIPKKTKIGYNSLYEAGKSEICYECFGSFHSDMILKGPHGGKYCGDCFAKIFTTCSKCGNLFGDRTKTQLYCETCRKEEIK